MPKAHDEWTVLDHGDLKQLEENLWHVKGTLPDMPIQRRMTVARMDDGRLVVHSAIAMSDSAMAELEALGTIAYVLVPNGWHRLDAPAYRKRYPDARLLCPRGSRKKVEQVVRVDGTYDDFPKDGSVSLEMLEGIKDLEGVMKVGSQSGLTLVFNDALFNVPHGKGVGGLVFRLLGSTGGPKVTRIMKLFAVKDKDRLREHLRRLADSPGLHRIIPGHGHIIDANAAAVLRQVASEL